MDRRSVLRLAAHALTTGAAGALGGWAYTAVAADQLTGLAADSGRQAGAVPEAPWVTSAAALRTGVLTADGGDRYDIVTAGHLTTVSAPESNLSGNLRVALWRDAEPPSADHQVTATFVADDHEQQPGLALRIRSDGGRTRAITVTKNIWMEAYWVFNVHVMDSAAPEPFRQVGSLDLASRFLSDGGRPQPYPWRMCAEVHGATLRFLVWTPWAGAPRWGDATSGGQMTLPAGWDAPGWPGLYTGHLPAGRTLGYQSVSTRRL
jgi:hypothetical protein